MKKGLAIAPEVVLGLVLGIIFFAFFAYWALQIPGLGGQILGFVTTALITTALTFWDILGKIFGSMFSPIIASGMFGILTSLGITLVPTLIKIGSAIGRAITSRTTKAIIEGLRMGAWNYAFGYLKQGLTQGLKSVKSVISNISIGSIITGLKSFAKGALIGAAVELVVTAFLNNVLGVPTLVNNAIGGGQMQTSVGTFSVGHATTGAISGALGGAAMGAYLAPFTLGASIAVGAAFGALIGFITSGFWH